MIQTIDFTVAKNVHRSTNPSSIATANVIINRNVQAKPSDRNAGDDEVIFPTSIPMVVPTPLSSDDLYDFVPEVFYKDLSQIVTNILKDNNSTLLINVIDPSGKVILKAEDLIHLISILTKTAEDRIVISYKNPQLDVGSGCCGRTLDKISPVKTIKGITINNNDFQFAFNKEFNLMKNNFSISLSLCQIKDFDQIIYG
jgi:hypothetical protein